MNPELTTTMNFRPSSRFSPAWFRSGLPILILSAAIMIAACSSDGPEAEPTPTPIPQVIGDADLGEIITLSPGQSIAITGEPVEAAFHTVFDDSRCPAGAQCVTTGTARVSMSIRGPDFNSGQIEYLMPVSTNLATPVGPYTLKMVSLEPDPPPEGGVNTSEYRVTFSVTKN